MQYSHAKHLQVGFTLIELLVVITLIGILAGLGMPMLNKQIEKARFSEVVAATHVLKTSVEVCVSSLGTVTGCTGGANGIAADLATPQTGYLDALSTANGVITATSDAVFNGSNAYTYVLTPTLANGRLTWAATGTCAAQALC